MVSKTLGDPSRARFVLRYVGEGASPTEDLARIRATPGVVVLDASERMLLAEGPQLVVQRLLQSLAAWEATPERVVPLPDTRRKVRRGPGKS